MSDLNGSEPARAGITLRELEVLRSLVESGTATAAAERLGISQPAVSRTLAQLEAQLGRQLFRREGGRLIPTPDALAIDAELDPIFSALARIQTPDGSISNAALPLYVAAPPSIAHRFLPGPVAQFARANPEHQIVVDVVSSDILVTYVAEGRVDLGIVDTEPNHASVRAEAFRSSDLVCLMSRDDPLAGKEVVGPADLDGRDFITQSRRHSVRAAQDAVFVAANAHPRSTIEVATVVLASELVREGMGIALINPFPTAMRLHPSLCMRPFEPRIPMRTFFMTPAAKRPSAATLAFMALVRAAADAIPEGKNDD
jgi:DNA-binding transcriptional LysR family regulator